MTLKPELMNAILSMDAYNRGYDASRVQQRLSLYPAKVNNGIF